MFHCQSCKEVVAAGQPENHVVVEKRDKTYENVEQRGPNRGGMKTTTGWEIAKTIRVCPTCYSRMTGLVPTISQPKEEKLVTKVTEPVRTFRPRKQSLQSRPRTPIVEKVNNFKMK